MDHQKNSSLIQFITFNIIGVLNVVLTMAIYFLLLFIGWHYLLALTTEYAFGICFSFFMNKRYTFKVRSKATSVMFGRMLATYGLIFLGNMLLLAIAVDALGINPYLAQPLVFSILMVASFLMQKFFVFRIPQVRH